MLPGTPLLNREYSGMTAEQIYEALKQPQDDKTDHAPEDTETESTSDGDSAPGGDDNGTRDDSTDDTSGDAERPGAVLDAPDPAQQEAEWQVALKQATQAAQMMGQLPAGMALAVEAGHEAPRRLEINPTAFRAAVRVCRLFVANA